MAAYQGSMVTKVIRDALNRDGWTQKRLADAMKVRPQTVNKWVSGENTPPYTKWRALEEALELDVGTILRAVELAGDDAQLGLLVREASEREGNTFLNRLTKLEAEVAEVKEMVAQVLARPPRKGRAPGGASS